MTITQETKNKIYDLFDNCLVDIGQIHHKLDLFIVPMELAETILLKTNVDVRGYWVSLDNYGILHTLENHGNPISEAKRGQIAVEKEDFIKMLDVFLYPDEIQSANISKHSKKQLLKFIKTLDDKIYVVKEVRAITSTKKNKISRLVLHTMYKTKAIKVT